MEKQLVSYNTVSNLCEEFEGRMCPESGRESKGRLHSGDSKTVPEVVIMFKR